MIQPVFDNILTIRCQYTFRMILNSAYVILLMPHGHYVAVIAAAGYLKAFRQTVFIDHPGVVASYLKVCGQSLKQVILCSKMCWCGYSVNHVTDVEQLGSKGFTYCLMSQADAQNRFAACV